MDTLTPIVAAVACFAFGGQALTLAVCGFLNARQPGGDWPTPYDVVKKWASLTTAGALTIALLTLGWADERLLRARFALRRRRAVTAAYVNPEFFTDPAATGVRLDPVHPGIYTQLHVPVAADADLPTHTVTRLADGHRTVVLRVTNTDALRLPFPGEPPAIMRDVTTGAMWRIISTGPGRHVAETV